MIQNKPQLILLNILIAVLNGFVCGFNVAMLATGNSLIPSLSGGIIVANAGCALWIAKKTYDRVTAALAADDAPANGAASSS
jgi:hypothetical protein